MQETGTALLITKNLAERLFGAYLKKKVMRLTAFSNRSLKKNQPNEDCLARTSKVLTKDPYKTNFFFLAIDWQFRAEIFRQPHRNSKLRGCLARTSKKKLCA
jgi:hypothetical protein